MRIIVFAAVGLCLTCFGQQPAIPEAKPAEQAAPDILPEQVLQRAIEATGGAAVREKIRSMAVKGDLEMGAQGIRGTIEVYSKAPDKRLSVTKIEGYGETSQGYDGKVAWAKDAAGNVRDVTGPQLAIAQREAQFNADLKWKEIWDKVEVQAKGKVGGVEAYVLKLTPKAGQPVLRYYDAETSLLLRSDMTANGPQGEFVLRSTLSDYREVEGIKLPFQVTQQTPMGTMGTRISEVKINVPLEDAMFAKPAQAPAQK